MGCATSHNDVDDQPKTPTRAREERRRRTQRNPRTEAYQDENGGVVADELWSPGTQVDSEQSPRVDADGWSPSQAPVGERFFERSLERDALGRPVGTAQEPQPLRTAEHLVRHNSMYDSRRVTDEHYAPAHEHESSAPLPRSAHGSLRRQKSIKLTKRVSSWIDDHSRTLPADGRPPVPTPAITDDTSSAALGDDDDDIDDLPLGAMAGEGEFATPESMSIGGAHASPPPSSIPIGSVRSSGTYKGTPNGGGLIMRNPPDTDEVDPNAAPPRPLTPRPACMPSRLQAENASRKRATSFNTNVSSSQETNPGHPASVAMDTPGSSTYLPLHKVPSGDTTIDGGPQSIIITCTPSVDLTTSAGPSPGPVAITSPCAGQSAAPNGGQLGVSGTMNRRPSRNHVEDVPQCDVFLDYFDASGPAPEERIPVGRTRPRSFIVTPLRLLHGAMPNTMPSPMSLANRSPRPETSTPSTTARSDTKTDKTDEMLLPGQAEWN
jgi:hypothetical protein